MPTIVGSRRRPAATAPGSSSPCPAQRLRPTPNGRETAHACRAVSASGASVSTSDHASSASGPADPSCWAACPRRTPSDTPAGWAAGSSASTRCGRRTAGVDRRRGPDQPMQERDRNSATMRVAAQGQSLHPASATCPESQEVWAEHRPGKHPPRRLRSPCPSTLSRMSQRDGSAEDDQPDRLGQLVGGGVRVGPLHRRVHERVHRRHQDGDLQDEQDGKRGRSPDKGKRAAPKTSTPSRPDGRLGVEVVCSALLLGDLLGREPSWPAPSWRRPSWPEAFLAGAFLAGGLLAFFGSSMPTSLAARSPTARVCEATVPSASWVSSTAWST